MLDETQNLGMLSSNPPHNFWMNIDLSNSHNAANSSWGRSIAWLVLTTPPFTFFMIQGILVRALLIGVMGSLSCKFFAELAAAKSFRSSFWIPSWSAALAIDCKVGTDISPHDHFSRSNATKADGLLWDGA